MPGMSSTVFQACERSLQHSHRQWCCSADEIVMWGGSADAVATSSTHKSVASRAVSYVSAAQATTAAIVAVGWVIAIVVRAGLPEGCSMFLQNLWTFSCSMEHLCVAAAASVWVARTIHQNWSYGWSCKVATPGALTPAAAASACVQHTSAQHPTLPVKQKEQQAVAASTAYIKACRVSSPNLAALEQQHARTPRRSQSFHIKWSNGLAMGPCPDEEDGEEGCLGSPKISSSRSCNISDALTAISGTRNRSYSQLHKSGGRAQVSLAIKHAPGGPRQYANVKGCTAMQRLKDGVTMSQVLCLDDDPLNQHVMKTLLAPENYDVLCMETGEDLLEHLQSCDALPDIILLDITLPGMSGFEVCAALRERYSGTDLPIIMLTGRTQEEDVVRGLELGANDYMTKPVRCLELKGRIATQLALKKGVALLQEARG